MTAAYILFCYLLATSCVAKRMEKDNTALWLILLLTSVLLSEELLSAFTLFAKLPLLILATILLCGVLFLEWKNRKKNTGKQRANAATHKPPIFEAGNVHGILPLSAIAAYAAFCPIAETDSVSYHLPIASQLVHTGSAWNVFQAGFVGPNTYFPANHEALQAFLMIASGDIHLNFLITLISVVVFYFALRCLADRGISDELTFLTLLSVISVPFLFRQFLNFQIDLFLFSMLGSSTAFLISAILKKSRMDAILAFLTLGLALGTKYNALMHLVFLLPLIGWLAYRLRSPMREWWQFPALCFLTGGFWYVRNWFITGNPLYPFGIRLLHWEGQRKVLAEMTGTSLWDALHTLGLHGTIHAVLANGNFPSEVGKVSLILPLIAVTALLIAMAVNGYACYARKKHANDSPCLSSFIICATLLYLLTATAAAYVTSPFTFTLWNEVVRYAAGFAAMIPVALVLSSTFSPRVVGMFTLLTSMAITVFNLLFKSMLFDPLFSGLVREKSSVVSGAIILLLLLAVAVMIVALVQHAKLASLPGAAASLLIVSVCLGFLSQTAFASTEPDDQFLAQELSGYAQLLPSIRALRREPAGGSRIIALAGLTPYWIFEHEGFRPLYVNIDGCDLCTYPDYRKEENSVRAHPDDIRWKTLLKKKHVAYLLATTGSRNAGSVLQEAQWADNDRQTFEPILRDQGVTLYKLHFP